MKTQNIKTKEEKTIDKNLIDALPLVDLITEDEAAELVFKRKAFEELETISREEIRLLVNEYYHHQLQRIRNAHQQRTLTDRDVPVKIVSALLDLSGTHEKILSRAIKYWASKHEYASYLTSNVIGLGPIICAGLLAHLDVTRAQSPSNFFSYCGLNPEREWLGKEKSKPIVNEELRKNNGEINHDLIIRISQRIHQNPDNIVRAIQVELEYDGGDYLDMVKPQLLCDVAAKRPWNAFLKKLCWLLGESFVKVKNKPDAVYAEFIDVRKLYENERNESGAYRHEAKKVLERMNIQDKKAKATLMSGRLLPAHIHARCKRYAVKQFIGDLHGYLTFHELKKIPCRPYVIEHGGHVHQRPNYLLPEVDVNDMGTYTPKYSK